MSHQYRRRTLADLNRPRVLDVAPGLVHESGPERHRGWAPERVAVMAHWSTEAEPSRSVVMMLRDLDAAGFETVLVSAAEVAGQIGRVCTWAPGEPTIPEATTVLRRANVGYDFGSWAAVLDAYPGIRRASRVLLVNDSLIGPFSGLGPILADFDASTTPVWGLSGSLQHRPHVQSFFMGFRDGVLDGPPMRAFWSDIRVESRKAKIVRYNELGLSEALEEAGIAWRTMLVSGQDEVQNPTINYWSSLLEQDFPFVKAEVVLNPPHWLADWPSIGPAVTEHFTDALDQWIPPRVAASPPRRPPTAERVLGQLRAVVDVRGPRGLGPAAVGHTRRRLRNADRPNGARR